MISVVSTRSWSSIRSALSDTSNGRDVPPSPSGSTSSLGRGSLGSSRHSSESFDEENVTITVSASSIKKHFDSEGQKDDLRLLTISSRITELQYTISDIQTRIFEIQELRHQSHAASEAHGASDIDTALSGLDERMELVTAGIKAMNESMEPFLRPEQTPTQTHARLDADEAALVRKHGALLEEWQALQRDADLIREELREDKWLTVFRTVTDQADGMMNSLDKAISRCQDFLRHLNSGGEIPPSLWPPDPDRAEGVVPNTVDVFIALTDTFEAKKRHYIPATNKVLSILDKGVQDRVTKNGECLRRHSESTQRWKALQSRLARTDAEMDKGRAFLLRGEAAPSEAGSSASGSTAVSARSGNLLSTPGSSQGGSRSVLSLSRSMSPLRKIARKLKGSTSVDPDTTDKGRASLKTPATEPKTLRRQRSSIFGFRTSLPKAPTTPEKGHRQTQSVALVETPPGGRRSEASASGGTVRHGLGPMAHAPAWNASTRVDPTEEIRERERTATLRPTPPRRPSALGFYQSLSALSAGSSGPATPYNRSASRSSMSSSAAASSRPWSPVTNNSSTASSGIVPPMPPFQPPGRQYGQIAAPPQTPRSRPKTPSAIPVPRSAPARVPSMSAKATPYRERSQEPDDESYFPDTPSRVPPPRPPSRSMIPMPALHLTSASRPGTTMSAYGRPDSAQSVRGGGGAFSPTRSTIGAPPSAFRESARTPSGLPSGLPSRPGSRAARMGAPVFGAPLHLYTPARGARDPMDAAVAEVANSVPHAFMVERVDAPLKAAPDAGAEQRATYAFSTPLGRKQLPLKFTAPGKSGDRRLLYRAGGGWNELRDYLLAHPA